MKKTFSILMACCFIFIGSSCGSQPKQPPHITATTTVYWVPKGKVYHINKNCVSLSRSKNIESGTVSEAKEDGKTRLCEVCGKDYKDDTK